MSTEWMIAVHCYVHLCHAWHIIPTCMRVEVLATKNQHVSRGSWGSSAHCCMTSFCEIGSSEWRNNYGELQPVQATLQLLQAHSTTWERPRTTTVYTSTIWHRAQADRPAHHRLIGLQTTAFVIHRLQLVIEVLSVYCFCYKTTCPREEREK